MAHVHRFIYTNFAKMYFAGLQYIYDFLQPLFILNFSIKDISILNC
jgi:hypothetical protein